MIKKIRTDRQYNQVMELIETFLKKATEQGGFHTLNKKDADELQRLSLLAEEYEDNILKVMPIPLTIKAMVQQRVAELDITQNQLAEMFENRAAKFLKYSMGKGNQMVRS